MLRWNNLESISEEVFTEAKEAGSEVGGSTQLAFEAEQAAGFARAEADNPSPQQDKTEVGYLTIGQENWNKTMRIWDLYIENEYKRKGVGTQLMKLAIEKSREYHCRALVLETQSSNYPAIQFYKKCGFELIGFDILAYSNTDTEKKEVRLELGLKLD